MTKDDAAFFQGVIGKLKKENKKLKSLFKEVKEELDLDFRIDKQFKDGIKNEDDVYYTFHLLDLKNKLKEAA